MNLHIPFLRSRTTEQIAGLRDQIIELGTHIRFMEADKPAPQPRSVDGRFISRRDIVADQLRAYVKATTPEQRSLETQSYIARKRAEAAKARGAAE